MPVAKDEFDVGPLSWVKAEIELALQRADEGITRFGLTPGDRDIARSTLTHLHQVSGALLMVGLEPVARVSEAMEKLVEGLDRDDIQMGPQITGAVHGAITALNQYLEGLMRGEPNRPLMLLPAYQGILAAGGVDKANEVDLFYPDLSKCPKFSEGHTLRPGGELAALLNLKRAEFQRGLLNLLRGNDVAGSLRTMRGALSTIEATQPAGSRLLWWIAVGFLDGLTQSPEVSNVFHKQLCGRIDLQIKRQAEGADTVSERLMRELLFAIAKMQPATERLREIQETYRLIQLMPQSAQENPETTRVQLLLHEVKDQLESIKESWLKFTSGNRACLNQFVEQTTALNILAQNLGNPALQTVFATLAQVGGDLAANPRDAGEALALETATTLLMAKDAVENYYRLGPNFENLAGTAVSRLTAVLKGTPMPGEGAAQLADVSRAAQEKLLFFQLGKEIFTNLNHIEQLLDAFFRDPAKRADLSLLPDYINQVQGAFAMLESKDAQNLLNASLALVQKFVAGEGSADPKDADLTAEAFSNLGLFVSALQQGHENPDELLHPVLARFNIAPTHPAAPAEEPEVPARAIEQDLDGQKRSMAGLFERWQREPQQESHRAALTEALSAIRQDAQLAGQTTLADQATRALTLLGDASATSAIVRETFIAMLGNNLLPAPQPVKPVGVVETAAAEIDAELLEIFLEEAAEVLGGIAIHRDVAMSNPIDREALIVIRRGFHTLKGSGRMVGLTEMGEVAWQVEQVMNKWLRDEKAVSKGLLSLIGDAHHSFSSWIETLHTGSQPDIKATHIFRLADQLKNDHEPSEESAPPGIDSIADGALRVPSLAEAPPIAASASAAPIVESESEPRRKINVGDVSLDADFFEIFSNEAQLHRATLLDHLAALRGDSALPISHEFMRAAHTLMGISRTSNIAPIAELGFGVEQW
nr:Hpt domain-containing protein [Burkholderiales bacterium]